MGFRNYAGRFAIMVTTMNSCGCGGGSLVAKSDLHRDFADDDSFAALDAEVG
jgi:hypothetical protein